MGINQNKSFLHWNYFLALQSDLENASRFIEFDKPNYKTYSIELAHLLMASASEVDVVVKGICKYLKPDRNVGNIGQYRVIIHKNLHELTEEKVYIPRFNITLTPWTSWKRNTGRNPIWWESYNDVKHHRSEQFAKANLKSVLDAMGGLLISVYYFYKLQFISEGRNIKARDDVNIFLKASGGFMQLHDSYYPSYLLVDKP